MYSMVYKAVTVASLDALKSTVYRTLPSIFLTKTLSDTHKDVLGSCTPRLISFSTALQSMSCSLEDLFLSGWRICFDPFLNIISCLTPLKTLNPMKTSQLLQKDCAADSPFEDHWRIQISSLRFADVGLHLPLSVLCKHVPAMQMALLSKISP